MPPAAKKTVAKSFTTDWQSRKASAAAITKFEESFGKEMGLGVLTRSDKIEPYKVIPSGSLALDAAIGIGGWPCGRVNEIWGPEHAGKTTECMLLVAEAQRTQPDKMAAWVDIEQTFDKKYAKKLGVDLKRLWLLENPQTAEEAADAVKRFVMSGLCSVVIVDSVGGMIGKAEFEKEAEDATVAIVAKVITRMVKQVAPMGKANGTMTMVVNQVRAIIGGNAKGPTTQSSGGWALKHVTSVKVAVRRGETKYLKIDGQDVPIGHDIINKVEKNKCSPYGRTATVTLYNTDTKDHSVGVDPVAEVVEFGKKYGIIEGSTWLTLPNGERFNGAGKTKDYLVQHPEVVKELREQVLAKFATQIRDDEGEDTPEDGDDPAGMVAFLAEQDEAPFGVEEKVAKA